MSDIEVKHGFFKLKPDEIIIMRCPHCKKKKLESHSHELYYMCTNCGFLVNRLGIGVPHLGQSYLGIQSGDEIFGVDHTPRLA